MHVAAQLHWQAREVWLLRWLAERAHVLAYLQSIGPLPI